MQEVCGLCVTMWTRSTLGIERSALDIDLTGTKMKPEYLAALGRALPSGLKRLVLAKTDLANQGKDLSGFRIFSRHLRDSGLAVLDLSENHLRGEDAALILADGSTSLTSIRYLVAWPHAQLPCKGGIRF